MHCRLLLVDDEPAIINALRRELLRPPLIGTDGIEVESFSDPADALARIAETDGYFDVAIVDYRMPRVDGIEFLDQVRQIQPDAVRILLSGLIDFDGAITAINTARVDHLLAKPWHEYDLKGRVALAVHQRQMRREWQWHAGQGAGRGHTDKPFSVLLVDDEVPMLNALQREISAGGITTRGPHPLFEIHATSAADAALKMIHAHCPDLVIADYAMPGMNGIELLYRVREECPNCARLLMSGNADLKILSDAINIAGVYHFIGKPWDRPMLRSAIASALAWQEGFGSDRVGTPPQP